MGSKKKNVPELDNPYFDFLAEIGVTKHLGGLKTTKRLVELCHIAPGNYVLDVGCGVGVNSCYLAKNCGCKVVGVDTSEEMVEKAKETARREGVEGKVEFRVADAQKLPFKDNLFDAVISESVTAFVKDKRRAMGEYYRVAKKGGYVGLNEVTWLSPPPGKVVEYLQRTVGDIRPEDKGTWKKLVEDAGFREVIAESSRVRAFSQAWSEVRLTGISNLSRAWGRAIIIYTTKPAYRKAINKLAREAIRVPKNFLGYFGSGTYAGRKKC